MNYKVEKDIRKATTLPARFYQDPETFQISREKIFAKSWQLVGDTSVVSPGTNVYPVTILEGFLDEPVVVTRGDDGSIQILSNVCTHRGNLVCMNPSNASKLVCGYHGRRFSLEGLFEHMPEFQNVDRFPSEKDNLATVQNHLWHQFLFAFLDSSGERDFNSYIKPMHERLGHLPIADFKLRPDLCKSYLVNAHWALYCDNYLEGFHIPFVHADLNAVIDYGAYETLLFDSVSLQIGYESGGTETFDLPLEHVDFGKKVAAYYFWLYPNTMFNFYPWGLSVNIVRPLSLDSCKVDFLTYMYDETKVQQSAGAILDKVEREDEAVVENVAKGVKSRFYKEGRYSPTREQGVHHFHRLISTAMNMD